MSKKKRSLESNVSAAMNTQKVKEAEEAKISAQELLHNEARNRNTTFYIPNEDVYYGKTLPEYIVSTSRGRGSGTSDTRHPVYESVENQVDPSINQYRNWIEQGKHNPVELATDLDFALLGAGQLGAKNLYAVGKNINNISPIIKNSIKNINRTYKGYKSLLNSTDDTYHYTGIPKSKITVKDIENLTDDQLVALHHNWDNIPDDINNAINKQYLKRYNGKGKLTKNIYSAHMYRGDGTPYNIGKQMYNMYNDLPINGKISIIQDFGLSRDSYPLLSSRNVERLINSGKARLNIVKNPNGTIRMQRLNDDAVDKRLPLSKVIDNVRKLTGEDVPNYVVGYNRTDGFGYYVPSVELEKLKFKNGGRRSLLNIK